MKKILGVAIVGGLLLFFVLRYAANGDKTRATIGPDTAAMATTNTSSTIAIAPPTLDTAVTAAPFGTVVVASDSAACQRLSDLCSTSDEKVDPAQCQKQLADARKMAGAGNVERSEQCLRDATTCAAASGCLTGGVGMGAMGEYLKGLGAALSH